MRVPESMRVTPCGTSEPCTTTLPAVRARRTTRGIPLDVYHAGRLLAGTFAPSLDVFASVGRSTTANSRPPTCAWSSVSATLTVSSEWS